MSVPAIKWAMRQTAGSVSAKAVLLVLAEHADDAGRCFPGQALIAKEAELSERSVRTQLQALEGVGLIRRTHKQRADGSRTADTIELALAGRYEPANRNDLPQGETAEPPAANRNEVPEGQPEAPSANRKLLPHGQPENDDTSNRNVVPIQPEARSGLTTFEPPVEPPEEPPVSSARGALVTQAAPKRRSKLSHPPTAEELAAFDAWWLVYPLKKGKHEAREAFILALRLGLAPVELLTDRAMAYAGERAGKDPRYTLHATTWLNQRRWEDEPTPAFNATDGPRPGHPMQGYSALEHALATLNTDEAA